MEPNINLQLSIKHLLIIILLIIILLLWYINNTKYKYIDDTDYKYSDTLIDKLNKKILNKLNNINNNINNRIQENTVNNNINNNIDIDIEKHNFIEKRDKNVLYDTFSPPERRIPEYLYPYDYVKKNINYPTRGLPEHHQLVGVVLRDSTETAYNLFGRQTFPKSNQYEYYVQSNLNDNSIKIPIKINNGKEIEDNQIIIIPGTDITKGDFKVKLYDYDIPRYIPY